jgi:hypothetical protein
MEGGKSFQRMTSSKLPRNTEEEKLLLAVEVATRLFELNIEEWPESCQIEI